MSSLQEVNPRVQAIGEPTSLQSRAARITDEIKQGAEKPFSRVIDVSSCDPHKTGMAPITFLRQVLAVCMYPELLKGKYFPPDVTQRAEELLGTCSGHSVGSYCVSTSGIPHVRESVARFIMKRDGGLSSDPDNIMTSGGSQEALGLFLKLLATGEGATSTAVLFPVPCPATLPKLLDLYGLKKVPYRLKEDQGWALDAAELRQTLTTARGFCKPTAIYISNPGNPTGHVQDRKTIEEVIHFAATEGLILLADEVNQDSIYGPEKEFLSYKRVLFEMGGRYSQIVELFSFNSLSSANMGECGLRGGYTETINLDPAVNHRIKFVPRSQMTISQIGLDIMVNPPSPGDPSYDKYTQEILHIQRILSQNARRACEFLNDLPGMSCQPPMAGVYLYPRVHLPPQIVEEAKMLREEADVFYCQRLLEEEGVVLGAGIENAQDGPDYHIRLCVLAPPTTMAEVLARLRSFHLRLLDKYL